MWPVVCLDRDIPSVFVSGAATTSTFHGREPVTDAIPSGESLLNSQ